MTKRHDKEAILRTVWNNGGDPTKRYIPRAYEKGPRWGVWDRLLGEFADERLLSIDAAERLTQ